MAGRRVAGVCGALALGGLALPALSLGASADAASSSSLSRFLFKSNEEPGYTVSGRPVISKTPSALLAGGPYTKSQTRSMITTLKTAGFVKAVQETTTGSNTNVGFSLVMQFSSAAGAQAAAARFLFLAKTSEAGVKPFSVAGVPGAKGVTVLGAAGGSANAYWSSGDCAFGSGAYDATATSAKAAAAPVQVGIKSLVKRVGTTCP